jgi:hypothetical protein
VTRPGYWGPSLFQPYIYTVRRHTQLPRGYPGVLNRSHTAQETELPGGVMCNKSQVSGERFRYYSSYVEKVYSSAYF